MPIYNPETRRLETDPKGEPSAEAAYIKQNPRCVGFIFGLPPGLADFDIDEFLREAESRES